MLDAKRRYWLILIVSLAAISAFVSFVALHLRTPSDGARIARGGFLSQGMEVDLFRSHPGGLQEGDVVIAVEGVRMQAWVESLFGEPPQAFELLIGDQLTYRVIRDGVSQEIPVVLGPYPFWAAFSANWGTIVYALVFLGVAAFVFIRRPDNPAGNIMFLAASCVTGSTAWSFGISLFDLMGGTGYWVYILCTAFFYNLYWIVIFHFALIFPQPNPILQRRWFLPAIYIMPMIILIGINVFALVQSSSTMEWLSNGVIGEGVHASLFLLFAISALIWQIRHSNSAISRSQIRWMLLASLFTGLAGFFFYILPGALNLQQISTDLLGLIIIPFPIVLAIAILRHNLFNIDTIINRALVYGSLTLGTILLYVFIVGTIADFFRIEDRTLIAFLATGLVAVLVQPVRDLLQRWVNRLMYGDRDDPYTVLSRLGRSIESTFSSDDVLTTILGTVAQALKLPYTALHLEGDTSYYYGLLPEGIEPERYLLTQRNPAYGVLEVAPRAADEPFSRNEQKLLRDLTRQIETAVRNVRLTNDLKRSRQKLVTTREEERRRIRRDLHDGLGPLLASQAMTLEAIEGMIKPDEEEAINLIQMLKVQSRDAITDIRRLVYDLRPPELDNLGLVEALRQNMNVSSQDKVYITFEVPMPLPPLSAAVEIAAYRIAQEALTNVVKHADASRCTVRLEPKNEFLLLDVIDNGGGLPEMVEFGIGMNSMRERAEELGGSLEFQNSSEGGVHISTTLPIS